MRQHDVTLPDLFHRVVHYHLIRKHDLLLQAEQLLFIYLIFESILFGTQPNKGQHMMGVFAMT